MCDLLRVTGPKFQRANSRIRFGNKPLSQNETLHRTETNLVSAWSGVAWECPEGRTASRKGILQIHTGTSTANSDFLRVSNSNTFGQLGTAVHQSWSRSGWRLLRLDWNSMKGAVFQSQRASANAAMDAH